mmetsp:Transcript_30967/g.64957  ORF Transcript_30967/g.64957 Transcript_30967/m.64957 type:complete len:315 (+) Transcript_30967:129-1073(+)
MDESLSYCTTSHRRFIAIGALLPCDRAHKHNEDNPRTQNQRTHTHTRTHPVQEPTGGFGRKSFAATACLQQVFDHRPDARKQLLLGRQDRVGPVQERLGQGVHKFVGIPRSRGGRLPPPERVRGVGHRQVHPLPRRTGQLVVKGPALVLVVVAAGFFRGRSRGSRGARFLLRNRGGEGRRLRQHQGKALGEGRRLLQVLGQQARKALVVVSRRSAGRPDGDHPAGGTVDDPELPSLRPLEVGPGGGGRPLSLGGVRQIGELLVAPAVSGVAAGAKIAAGSVARSVGGRGDRIALATGGRGGIGVFRGISGRGNV